MPNQDNDDDDKSKVDDQDVDTSTEEDETLNDDDTQNGGQDDDTEDSGEDDDDSESDDDSQDDSDDEDEDDKFSKRFSQIQGDSIEEYTPNLEEAYLKSSREGKRLAQQNKDLQGRLDSIAAAVAKNPELAKQIEEATKEGAVPPTVDPAVQYARDEMEKKMETDYNNFVKVHPELDTDPQLQEKVLAELNDLGAYYRSKGKILSMDEGLKKAWSNLGLDKDDDKERIAMKAKETASKSRTASTNKKGGKSEKSKLTEEQIAVGKKMGLSEKQMLVYYGK